MRIYTKAGDLAFRTFTFPDGQPHFKLETYEVEFGLVTVETAIKTSTDLVMVVLVSSVLRACGYTSIQLDIRYLLGARMDRAISPSEPFTLDVVARIINSCGFSRVRCLDAHSEVATRLIRGSSNVLPTAIVKQVMNSLAWPDVVVPDKGAMPRVSEILKGFHCIPPWIHQCYKERDLATGRLTNFRVPSDGLKDRDLLIVDDICDGGGTFVGLAKELRAKGAKSVNLFVTHGIFSKTVDGLDGIDKVFTTDSYTDYGSLGYVPATPLVVIPVSMKEL